MRSEVVKLRIGNIAKAVLVTGQAYQDPKDALNEFVSNAADEYAEMGITGERIRVLLRRQGRHPLIAVSDDGRGLPPQRLRQLAQNLFESRKAGDDRTLGEKAIGLLAFQQLGGRCEIVSRAEGAPDSHVLRLERGSATARLELERKRARDTSGTTVYLADLDPEVARLLTQNKVVDYLRLRRGTALARGDYVIEVASGRTVVLVTPEKPDGVRVDLPPRPTLWGRIEFTVHVAPRPDRRRRVAIVGRGGTTIIDSITELEEFDHAPWNSDLVGGQIIFEALAQSAGRRAVIRDRDSFPLLVDAVAAVEPTVARTLDRVARDLDAATADRVSDEVRRLFSRVLRELADIDNPMRTLVGTEPGEGALLGEASHFEMAQAGMVDETVADDDLPPMSWPSQQESSSSPRDPPVEVGAAHGAGRRARHLPSLAIDPDPGRARSRFDAEAGVVLYNDTHPDYLLVKETEVQLLDYLATLVAKEYVVYNNPRSAADELAEEMVRMLVRLRRHMRRR